MGMALKDADDIEKALATEIRIVRFPVASAL
jgi:hypothetical protein